MDGCACIDVHVDVITTTISRHTRCARKEHTCNECGRTIQPKEKYENFVGNDEGDLFISKTCWDCLSVRDEFFCGQFFWGRIWEDLWDHITYTHGELSSEAIVSLTPAARDKVLTMVEEYWYEDDLDNEEEEES